MAMAYYRRMVLEPVHVYDAYPEDDVYVEKMQTILSAFPCVGVPREPSPIMGNVYLGSNANAENLPLLKVFNINYILNCDGGSFIRFRRLRDMYGPETGIQGYDEIPAEDREDFNIRGFFEKVHAYIDYVRGRGGRILIHCPGVSRSGAIAISYLIHNGMSLLEATRVVKDKRRVALGNPGFMKQLVEYARERGVLDADLDAIHAPKYFTPLNRHRIRYSHLPTIF